MTGHWRKQLGKASDCYFRLTDPKVWNLTSQFESLLIHVCFPFLPHRPQLRERSLLARQIVSVVQSSGLSKDSVLTPQSLLCQLLTRARNLLSVQGSLVWIMLPRASRHCVPCSEDRGRGWVQNREGRRGFQVQVWAGWGPPYGVLSMQNVFVSEHQVSGAWKLGRG